MAHEPLKYGCYYHIYNRGNNGETLFSQGRNYPYFLKLYMRYLQPVAVTYAYCLMPNHFHFAIRTYTIAEQEAYSRQHGEIGSFSENEPIFKPREPSRAFNYLFIAYAKAYNRAIKRTGVLFETPFRRKLVDNAAYFSRLIPYIHRNPEHHNFVDDFRDWPWTSYGALLSQQPTHLNRDEVITWYGDRANLRASHDGPVLDFEDVM